MYWLKNNWIFLVGAVVLLMYFLFPQTTDNPAIQPEKELIQVESATETEVNAEPVDREERKAIKVDIKGEVKTPGIYEMVDTNRVSDLIDTAGGLTTKADSNQVNLAQKLVDEMVVYVPAEGEEETTTVPLTSMSTGTDSKVNLNQATKEEIMSLNGIGEKKAEAILAYREENGPFTVTEDLLQVSGIGEKTLENLTDMIQVP